MISAVTHDVSIPFISGGRNGDVVVSGVSSLNDDTVLIFIKAGIGRY